MGYGDLKIIFTKNNLKEQYLRPLECCNKNATDWIACKQQIYFSSFWRLESPRPRFGVWWEPKDILHCALTGQKGRGSFLGSFFIRILIPFTWAIPPWSISSQRSHLQTASHCWGWGVLGISIYELWGDMNIQIYSRPTPGTAIWEQIIKF